MAHGRQGRKRATPRQRSGRWNVDETRDCLHGQLRFLGRMFLEAFIGPRVRCTHGQTPRQQCHWFSVARMRLRTPGVAGDVLCEPPPFSVSHLGIFCMWSPLQLAVFCETRAACILRHRIKES
ncbi:hypothetical protein TcCL_NonESM09581 [Trypanosoma cruzi]|nr:hypothetical protein TcCL_NonESM09581 [Trypanosoma cruzi]